MSSSDTERFVSNWNRIHKETSRVLRAAPDDKLEWRPKENMFTLRELIGHIPQAELVLARSALAGSTQKPPFDFSNRSGSEIAGMFDSQHDELVSEVSKLTAEQLKEEVEFHGRTLRRGVLLWFLTEHEIHHRGQLFTYYRLADIEPPNLHE
ncbi:MAG: DinB family protein [Acidobacteriota bacterium]